MARYVPDSELMDLSCSRNPMGGEPLMELLWLNGQVVIQPQSQRSFKNIDNGSGGGGGGVDIPFHQSATTSHAREDLLMDGETEWRQPLEQVVGQDDDLSSWLQFPFDDLDGGMLSNLLFSPPAVQQHEIPSCSGATMPSLQQYTSFAPFHTPIGPLLPQFLLAPSSSAIAAAGPSNICSTDVEGIAAAAPKFQSFLNFSTGMESVPASSMKAPRECTPAAAGKWVQRSGFHVGGTSGASKSNARKGLAKACEPTVTASTASGSIEGTTPPVRKRTKAEGKRRVREVEYKDCQSDDDDDHAAEVKKQTRKPMCVKKTRKAEVHNLSERRRRDRINSKLKVLKGMIPNCNKVDKASMLDDAIEYLKALEHHVKVMSMGGGMHPMMYPPGSQQRYIAAMGMGMDMGAMNQPMITCPTPGYPPQASGAGPSFPMPPFPLQPIPVPPLSFPMQPIPVPSVSYQQYSTYNSIPVQQGSNQPQLSNPPVVDPYQYFTAFQEPQVPTRSFVQNRSVVRPSTTVPSSSVDAWNPENQRTG